MSKVLGLDIGTNSIGWAIADTSANKIIDCGVKVFPEALQRHSARPPQIFKSNKKAQSKVCCKVPASASQLLCSPVF